MIYNRNREGGEMHYDANGFLVRPEPLGLEIGRDYDVVYLGYNGDGHFGRYNLTASFYYAGGHDTPGTFVQGREDISAFFGALELSRDFDWIRARLSLLYASGDRNPFDRRETGFDAILENPQFAAATAELDDQLPCRSSAAAASRSPAPTEYSMTCAPRRTRGIHDNLGTILGIGADLDLSPQLRMAMNLNDLSFVDTQVIDIARSQGGVLKHIGEDTRPCLLSAADVVNIKAVASACAA